MEKVSIEEIISELNIQGIPNTDGLASKILQYLTELADIYVSQYLENDSSGHI